MPEGDTLHKLAAVLEAELTGQEAVRVHLRDRGELPSLRGERVVHCEAIGKHLLVHFANERTLRIHLGLRGSMHKYPHGLGKRAPDFTIIAAIDTASHSYACVRGAQAELMRTKDMARHPKLSKLGPDLVKETVDESLCARARASGDRPLVDVLLDQRIAAGIGNVYKSEILYLEQLDPFALVSTIDDATLTRLYARARELLRRNLHPGFRVTTPFSDSRGAFGARHWVYGRANRPCFRCRSPIVRKLTGDQARSTYFCPQCQRTSQKPATRRNRDELG